MAEAKKSTKKIIDVQHPGKTAPSGTSKSVIVTNRPIMKDPMVVDEDGKPEESAPAATTYKSGGEAVIKPLTEQDSKEEKTESTEADKSKTISQLAEEASKDDKKADDTQGPELKEEVKDPEIKLPIGEDDKKEDTEEDKKTPQPTEKAEEKVDEKADEKPVEDAAESKPEDDKPELASTESDDKSDKDNSDKEGDPKEIADAEEDKELKKRRAEVNKLVESKKYSLPIKTVENRHNRRAVIIGVVVSILLILAWINIALDAGLISLGGVKAYTNFF